MNIETAKKLLKRKTDSTKRLTLSSGSTLLNLACSDKPRAAFYSGCYYYIVGDSASGKTFLSLTCFAEACKNPNFDNYRLIFDDVENGALMNFEKFFGKTMASRIEPPSVDKDGEPVNSTTIQEFYMHLDDAGKAGKPFIYLLDSMDSLSSEEEEVKIDKKRNALRNKKAGKKEEKVAGSYGDGKAKINSTDLRPFINRVLKKTNSILIVIGQTRDAIPTPGQMLFEKKTRAGGHALNFYATLIFWSSQAGKIKKTVNEKPRELGVKSSIRVKKNRVNGKDRTVVVPIYHSYGIDDVGSCVDFLLEEGHWKKKAGIIKAKEFDFTGKREQLIKHIEDGELERELQDVVAEVWASIEEQCVIQRKARYE